MPRPVAVFDDHYIPEPNSGCWLWLRSLNTGGYGEIKIGHNKRVLAHRFSYERANGPLILYANVLHKCDMPSCVNPDHLFVGTDQDNSIDMVKKGRGNLQKLSEEQVLAIRDDLRSLKEVAADYSIDPSAVSLIRNKKRWKHIP